MFVRFMRMHLASLLEADVTYANLEAWNLKGELTAYSLKGLYALGGSVLTADRRVRVVAQSVLRKEHKTLWLYL